MEVGKTYSEQAGSELNLSLGAMPPLGPVLVRLMKGAIYRENHEKSWQDLLLLEHYIRDYVRVMGLDLMLNDTEGYAYLNQAESGEESAEISTVIPRIMQRRSLSYPVSLLCVLLRKRMVEADVGGEDTRIILTREQMAEMMRVFLKDQPNEARLVDQVDATINKIVKLGFLQRFSKEPGTFEVKRIIKDLINADWLTRLDEILETYHAHAAALD